MHTIELLTLYFEYLLSLVTCATRFEALLAFLLHRLAGTLRAFPKHKLRQMFGLSIYHCFNIRIISKIHSPGFPNKLPLARHRIKCLSFVIITLPSTPNFLYLNLIQYSRSKF
jgi:hypothetical protein